MKATTTPEFVFEFNDSTRQCTVNPISPPVTFGEVTKGSIAALDAFDSKGFFQFCVRNTTTETFSIGGPGSWSIVKGHIPSGSTFSVLFNNGTVQEDLNKFPPVILSPGQSTTQIFPRNGFLKFQIDFDGTQHIGHYHFTVQIATHIVVFSVHVKAKGTIVK